MIKKFYFKLILFVCVLTSVQPNENVTLNGEKKNELDLYKYLFDDYNKEMKPSASLEIKFALNLNQIVTLIEREQILVVNVFLDHEWIDERLKWNPKEFDNITLLRISSDKLWA